MSSQSFKASIVSERAVMSWKIMFMIVVGLLFCTALFSQQGKGQSVPKSRFVTVVSPDTTYRSFLDRQDSLGSISLAYTKNPPQRIILGVKDPGLPKYRYSGPNKHFDLLLVGDRYFFSRKYGEIQDPSTVRVDQIAWPEKSDRLVLRLAKFDGDSVTYVGEIVPPDNPLWSDDGVMRPIRYRGDITSLAKKIEQGVREIGAGSVVDSALVFEGTVTREYELKDFRLVLGGESAFSDLAVHVLLEKGDDELVSWPKAGWYPATANTRPLEARSRIFVRLEQDGSVTIETPSKLWSTRGN